MKLGFAGTCAGLTKAQGDTLGAVIGRLVPDADAGEFHHGNCIGADSEAHCRAVLKGIPVVIHLPEGAARETVREAYDARPGEPHAGIRVLPRRPHPECLHAIVDATDVLVACPSDPAERAHGGTWAAVQHARRRKKPICIVLPDGTIRTEEGAVSRLPAASAVEVDTAHEE